MRRTGIVAFVGLGVLLALLIGGVASLVVAKPTTGGGGGLTTAPTFPTTYAKYSELAGQQGGNLAQTSVACDAGDTASDKMLGGGFSLESSQDNVIFNGPKDADNVDVLPEWRVIWQTSNPFVQGGVAYVLCADTAAPGH